MAHCRHGVASNGLRLGVRSGLGVQSVNLLLKLIGCTKLQVFTTARLKKNPCYTVFIFRLTNVLNVSSSDLSLKTLFGTSIAIFVSIYK